MRRIAELANNDPYRVEVLLTLTELRQSGKRYEQWMQEHDRLDTMRFEDINTRLVGVVSGVTDYKDTEAQVKGMKKLIVGLVTTIAAIGGFIYFLAWAIKELRS